MATRLQPTPTSDRRLEGVIVLVVDDTPDIRLLLTRLLRRQGAVTFEAGSVREALDLMQRIKPDVIVSDIAMPEQSGYDLIRAVRHGLPAINRTPAVAISGFTQEGYRLRSLTEGFQVHLGKPFDHVGLIDLVAQLAEENGGALDHDWTGHPLMTEEYRAAGGPPS